LFDAITRRNKVAMEECRDAIQTRRRRRAANERTAR